MTWYNLSEEERISQVYGNYTIEQFWNWWAGDNTNQYMEVRIMDIKVIKDVAYKMQIPYCASGVFVKSAKQLKNVIALCRNKVKMWFSVNPRKWAYNRWGKKGLGGTNYHVESINFLFIDVDRVVKDGPANNVDLEQSQILVDKILERLEGESWAKNYCDICSGNGSQLLIKLDYPIKIPVVEFDNAKKFYIDTPEYEGAVALLRNGVGNLIQKFSNKLKKELGVEVDKSCFKIAQVAALPFSKNFKFDSFTWRGIVELKDEEQNNGLSDYIINYQDKEYADKKIFIATKKQLMNSNVIRKGKLRQHKLVKFMMDQQLPHGELNNVLWFSMKMLLRDSKIDLGSMEFKMFHKELEAKYRDNFPLNLPNEKCQFSENTINNYCIRNRLPPLYFLREYKNKKLDMKIEDMNELFKSVSEKPNLYDEEMEIGTDTTIQEDMGYCKTRLVEGDYNNRDKVASFIKALIKKYNIENAKYYCQYLLQRWLCYE